MKDERAGSTAKAIRLARWTFILAALFGIPVFISWIIHTPAMVGRASAQQPEIYYGFGAIGLGWQFVFLLIASDPMRYRPLMLVAAFGEKFAFTSVIVILLVLKRAGLHWIPPAAIDFGFGCAFIISYFLTSSH